MHKYITYIFILISLIITSCADDIVSPDEDVVVPVIPDSVKTDTLDGVRASLPELIDGNAAIDGVVTARSTLIYDRIAKKTLFSWGSVDAEANVGVFNPAQDQTSSLRIPVNFVRQSGQDASALSCKLEPSDNEIQPLTANTSYIAFRPFVINKEINFKSIDVSYQNQQNPNNVKMGSYFHDLDNNGDYKEYEASEALASSHLGPLDYLVSAPQTTNEEYSVYFPLQRVGVVARFYIKYPISEIYEQLQLVSQGAQLFTLTGTLDLSERKITAVTSSNVMVLDYGYDETSQTGGMDMSNNTNTDYYDNGKGYIVSYLMLAPVDLSGATSIHLYLLSHTASEPGKTHYWKSTDLKKPNLTANMFYQWTSADNDNPDEPITFTEVTFQEFQEGTKYSNKEGNGTQTW